MDAFRIRPPFLLAAFIAVAVVAGAVSGSIVALLMDDSGDAASTEQSLTQPSPTRSAEPDENIIEVAARAMPSVVTIINQGEVMINEDGLAVEPLNSGSGVIVDEAGFIITNEHVVSAPGSLSVVLDSGEQRPAVLVSHDAPFTDLAVLQIPQGGLRALPFGDSDQLEVGQTVLAIGSALFEYRNSITTGIISGVDRRYLRQGIFLEDLIQTDAAINTGNSGGPLVTLDGRMVGLVSNVVRSIGEFENVQGISFAISSRTIAPIVEAILTRGAYPRPYFGIEHRDLDVPSANELGLPTSQGALVEEVFPASPAAEAGVEPGDIVLAVGENEIDENFTFLNALAEVGAADRVPVQLLRNDEVVQLSLQLAPRE